MEFMALDYLFKDKYDSVSVVFLGAHNYSSSDLFIKFLSPLCYFSE